ncbi:NGK_0946 family protein [Brachymonas chironomi]|uniref:NGK_0946 family protein n=1 Tax=Brachymonas chironomi TaxID=491919 RepID=UPI000361340F|nr:hypothetical protein [Brachymonas chironomi]
MSYRLITTALLASLLAACATENTASHYATGDDAAVVKQGRNRSVAQLSESELRQHRRQRVDAAEEMALDVVKRRAQNEQLQDGLSTANRALETVNGVIGTIRNLRWGF